MVLALIPGCEAACERSDDRVEVPPVGLRLLGDRMILREAGELVHVFDDEHAPYLTMARPFVPLRPRLAGLSDAAMTVTSTATRGDRVHVRLAISGVSPGFDGQLRAGGRTWRVRWVPAQSAWPELAEVRGLTVSEPERAQQRLEAMLSTFNGPVLLAAHVERLRLLRRLKPADYRKGLEAWRRAAEQVGAVSEHSRALRALAFQEFYQRQFEPAEALLDAAQAIDEKIDDDRGRVRGLYYRVLIFTELGRHRSALKLSTRALELAESAGLDADVLHLAKARTASLMQVGRYADAWRTLEAVRRVEDASAFDQGAYFSDRGWVLARGMAAGIFPRDWARVERELNHARSVLGGDGGLSDREAIVVSNLLLVRYLADDLDGCRGLLAEFDAPGVRPPPHVLAFTQLMRGHLALRDGRPREAMQTYQAALDGSLRDSGGGRASDSTWRAHYGLARAAERMGQPGQAEASYLSAIEDVEALARRTQLGTDRAAFIDDHQGLFIDAVDAFLRRGRLELALRTADRSRAQPYRVLYARAAIERLDDASRLLWRRNLDRYQAARAAFEKRARAALLVSGARLPAFRAETETLRLALEQHFDAAFSVLERAGVPLADRRSSIDDLRAALGPNEGLLVPWSGTSDVWFGVRPDGVVRFDAPPAGPWWRREGSTPSHLHVAAMGAENPWRALGSNAAARAWLAEASVSFVPYPSMLRPRDHTEGQGRATIVADPTSDLPWARAEAAAVKAHFEGATVFLGKAATRAALLSALVDTDHFHFAGHGVLNPADPWGAHLALASGERLTLEDVFASRPRARHVVLSGCETGRATAMSRTVRIGLPEAFVAGGARTVVATTRAVSDAEAKRFIDRFYAAGGATEPAAALRKVALDSTGDAWSAYYVLGVQR